MSDTKLSHTCQPDGSCGGDNVFFQALLYHMPIPVCVINSAGQFIFQNPSFTAFQKQRGAAGQTPVFALISRSEKLAFEVAATAISSGDSALETVPIFQTPSDPGFWLKFTPTGIGHGIMITVVTAGRMIAGKETIERHVQDLFGLTGMETRCALLLANGLSASAIAKKRGVSVPTVRTQLRTVREKMRVNSSLAIVAQISKLSTSLNYEGLAAEHRPGHCQGKVHLKRYATLVA